jgi:hypothetical protein
MPNKCPRGKVINPLTGRCVNKNGQTLKKALLKLEYMKKFNMPQVPQRPI